MFNYTNRQRIHETKRLKYQQLLHNFRSQQGILQVEQELSGYNSKTCDPDLFMKYMIKKIEINDKLYQLYADRKYRQYRWYGFLNRIRSEDHLVNNIINMSNPLHYHKNQTISNNKQCKSSKRSVRKKNRNSMKNQIKTQRLQDKVASLKRELNISNKIRLKIKTTTVIPDPDLESIYKIDETIKLLDQQISQLTQSIDESHRKICLLCEEIKLFKKEQPVGHKRKRRNKKHKDKIQREKQCPVLKISKLIMGDWSIGKQMRNFISTPNIRLERKIASKIPIYKVDEFRSSCLFHKTGVRCDNLYLPDLTSQTRKIHSVLTYQMENQRLGCINRDSNGRQNIKKLFDYYLMFKTRPERYKRGVVL